MTTHSWTREKARSSSWIRRPCGAGWDRIVVATRTAVSAKTAAIVRKAARHPAACPRAVSMGTPTRLATVSPDRATAAPLPCEPGPMREAASSDATPR